MVFDLFLAFGLWVVGNERVFFMVRDGGFWQFQATRGYHFFGEPLIARGGLYNLCWCGPPAEGALQKMPQELGA